MKIHIHYLWNNLISHIIEMFHYLDDTKERYMLAEIKEILNYVYVLVSQSCCFTFRTNVERISNIPML